MNFEEYQKFTPTTAIYPGAGTWTNNEILYLTLGLMGELDEWGDTGKQDMKEMGDVLWHISQLSNVFSWKMASYWERPYYPSYGPVGNVPEALKKMLRDGKCITQVIERLVGRAMAEISIAVDRDQGIVCAAMSMNRDKLTSRQERGTLKGDGDNR